MEKLLVRQSELIADIERIGVNFSKDSSTRKTRDYIEKRVHALDEMWKEFETNNKSLAEYEDKQHEYFTNNIYVRIKEYYETTRRLISAYPPTPTSQPIHTPVGREEPQQISFEVPKVSMIDKATVPCGEVEELLSRQRTNFRAFFRLSERIDELDLYEKWEVEDELRNLDRRWLVIDELHLRIDNILQADNANNNEYYNEFNKVEKIYHYEKRQLNRKLNCTVHLNNSTPKLEIPTFSGNYISWPTFFDLFTETIHNNMLISKAQKMQHLKTKLKGEAERLVQHLHVSAENYDTAWEILTHRYNNPQVLFANQIEIFLNQPTIHRQSSYELKRLHDTSMECIHAIHNLGVDTSTWDPLLVHLISKKLDAATYSDYKESRKSPRDLPSLEELMNFLESKFTALEPLSKREKEHQPVPKTNFPLRNPKYAPNKYNYSYQSKHQNRNYQSFATNSQKCPICTYNSEHQLFQCKRFINLPADAKLRAIAKNNICQNCLFNHYGNKCISSKRCKECNLAHNTLLHNAIAGQSPNDRTNYVKMTPHVTPLASTSNKTLATVPSADNKQHNAYHVSNEDEEILLTTLSLKVKANDGTYVTLRGLLDQGSQITLISENAAQRLGLRRTKYPASVSGIGSATKQSKGMVTLDCLSIYDDYQFTTQALVMTRVINNLPNSSFNKQVWSHLQHIRLADPEYNISKPIDLLLDASVYSNIIMSGLIKGPTHAPIAQQTKMGWVLSGNVKTFHCHVIINNTVDISKYWEVEDIKDSGIPTLTPDDQYSEDLYQATTKRLESGRYEVALPMKPDFENHLGISKPKAIAQFLQQERKMLKNLSLLEKYRKFMEEYRDLGHMRKAETTQNSATPICYIPHHAVFKPDSMTTALRVVFNASSPTSTGYSLNDLMNCGPNLQRDLLSLIIQWRKHKYVVTADIEKMFRQILIRSSDQPLQSIIWRDSPTEPLEEYYLTTVTYGTKAAPYLAMRTLRKIAEDNADRYSLAAASLATEMYMDDLLSGNNCKDHIIELILQMIQVLQEAGINIRKWSSNDSQLIKDLPSHKLNIPFEFKDSESRKTLGLQWNPSSDTFTFQNKLEYEDNKKHNSKRQLLSDVSKIYDPLGWLAPITIKAKLLFQKTWLTDLSWDDELPNDIWDEWLQHREGMKNINKFVIPRHIGNTENLVQVYGFSDASEKAYACCIYAVTQNDKGEYTSRLITAKTKVAPCKNKVSLPRMELLGALLLSLLMKKTVDSLSLKNIKINAFSDSMVVLSWLQGDLSKWKPFVANRVKQILSIIPSSCWRHVKSEDNAADCASRGMTTTQLLNHSLWWRGPDWLTNFNSEETIPITYPVTSIEEKKPNVSAALQSNEVPLTIKLLNNNSSITKVIKTMGWVSRFITLARAAKQPEQTLPPPYDKVLSPNEIEHSLYLIIKQVQLCDFEDDLNYLKKHGHVRNSSKLSSLSPILDKNGILRVGGRLEHANISYGSKHPIIISSHSRFTELIIDQAHKITLHGGPKLTLSYIRENYWIISGVRSVKKQIRRCVKCCKLNQERHQQIMADLPQPRVTPARPFSKTGVDFTGFIDIKSAKGRGVRTSKGYVAVFVCLATKAVHIELVSDLSSASFLAAFRRLCARRGTPKDMFSDNGTNFVGASRLLKEEYQQILSCFNTDFIKNLSELGVTWHFNAPAWPNASGLMEAAVKSFKYHLKRTLGEQRLTYEEFTTVLHQIEACLNSRPLCALTENTDDLYLTPGHFLVGDTLISRPQTDPDVTNLSTRWQMVQSINKQFWKKWSSEYLQQLQSRSKWRTVSKNIKIDDVVVIKEDNMPAGKWAIGRVVDTHPGSDGLVRVVSLKTQNNIIKRPINKLALLPINNDDNSMSRQSSKDDNANLKQPRRTRKPILSSLLSTLLLFLFMLSPSIQSATNSYNITKLNHQSLYFDKISDLQHIRDEWKLVVFYNLSTYWQSISSMDHYITHLKQISCTMESQYKSVTLQLEHELSEIEHYNKLLKGQNNRKKRGFINGIGYAMNSLFGVLDEKFAEQYEIDIQKIASNENHLQNLIKNQTLIIESQNNILRRNENIMNKQFTTIKEHLNNVTLQAREIKLVTHQGLYLTSSALAASIILSSLRRMQQTLLDSLVDLRHGSIDTHLLPPEQLDQQISIITNQLKNDLTIPIDSSNPRDLYKLLRVYTRIQHYYFIIEIRIPLVSSEMYELDKIISIPQRRDEAVFELKPTFPYIAFNLRKDMAIMLSDFDLQSCMHIHTNNKLLCSIDKPIYDMKLYKSLCDIKLLNEAVPCSDSISKLKTDRWIKLHRENTWIFSCYETSRVRIFCKADMEIVDLNGNGLLTLQQGCTLKGDTFTIHSHNHYFNNIKNNFETVDIPRSALNNLINTSIPTLEHYKIEDHEQIFSKLTDQINNMKEQENYKDLSIHDVHHYSAIYVLAIGLLLVVIALIYLWWRKRSPLKENSEEVSQQAPQTPTPSPRLHQACGSMLSVRSVDQGTSPIMSRSVKFEVPSAVKIE